MASRGAVRTPFPNRSTKRDPNTIPQPPARASKGRLSVDIPYPNSISGLRRPRRSLIHPATIFSRLAVVSAIPSISPMMSVLTPSTLAKKMGISE